MFPRRDVFFLLSAVCILTAIPARAELRVGAAHIEVTPATGKIRDRLYASAIVIDNLSTRGALIGVDAGGLSEGIWQAASKQIAEDLKCPVSNIVLSATHTHSSGDMGGAPAPASPGAGGAGRGGPPQAAAGATGAAGRGGGRGGQVNTAMVDKIVAAVREANSKLQPARVAYGKGSLTLNVNRDAIHPVTHTWYQGENLAGDSDKTISVVKFESLTGQPIAFYVNYAMHPINYYLTDVISSDFPGQLSRYLEQSAGNGAIAVFSQGASGNQNPLYHQLSFDLRSAELGYTNLTWETLAGTWANAPAGLPKPGTTAPNPAAIDKASTALDKFITATGAVMGEEVLRVSRLMPKPVMDASIWSGQKEFSCPGRSRTDQGREGMTATYVDAAPVTLRVGVLRIGPIAFATVDGEVYSQIAQKLKQQSPLADTMVVTLADGGANSGYIPDDESFSHLTFQVLGSRLKPGCAEDGIVNTAVELLNQSLGK